MLIDDVRAVPISFPVPLERSVRLGIGRSVKRDAVLVRVTTDDGYVGWGEAHHGRAPGAIARLVDTTLREPLIGRDASDVTGAWTQVYRMHDQGLQAAEGSGSEEGTEWPAEKSYFALGLQLDAAKQIGRHFDQDAIVWVGADAVPQFILLR